MKPILRVFVVEHCASCAEARALATQIAQEFPEVAVEVVDIGNTEVVVPEAVFATPTFVLNNRIVSLGNPYPQEIARVIEEATAVECSH